MAFSIRKARPEDAPGVQEVFYRTWMATYPNEEHGVTVDDLEHRYAGYNSPERTEKTAKRIRELPQNEGFWVAEEDGSVIGVCHAIREKEQNLLRALYILPAHQGKGVGTAFMAAVDEFFDPNLPCRVDVATYNERAIEFYERFGYRDTGRTFTEERFRMKSGSIISERELRREPKR